MAIPAFILAILLALALIGIFNAYVVEVDLRKSITKLLKESNELEQETQVKLKKEVSRNKSVEVRTGQIMEVMAPFLKHFKFHPKEAQFLGNPIDYVVFGIEDITFVEIKSGKSKLSLKQRRIKKMVEEGKVRFETVRFDYE